MMTGQRESWPVDEEEGFPIPMEEQMYSYKMQRHKMKVFFPYKYNNIET